MGITSLDINKIQYTLTKYFFTNVSEKESNESANAYKVQSHKAYEHFRDTNHIYFGLYKLMDFTNLTNPLLYCLKASS